MHILLVFFLAALSTLAMVHITALEFFLYYQYLWLDMPMHFLGGACIALGLGALPFFKIHLPPWLTTLSGTLVIVFIVGTLWEIFELMFGISVAGKEDIVRDTAVDFVFDLLGGTVGYYVGKRIRM